MHIEHAKQIKSMPETGSAQSPWEVMQFYKYTLWNQWAVGRLGVARMVRLGIAQMDRSGIAFCRRLVAHACVLICLLAMYVYIRACASMYALVCACRRVYRMTYVTCMFHDICYYVCWRVHVCGCVHVVLTCMPCGVCPRTR